MTCHPNDISKHQQWLEYSNFAYLLPIILLVFNLGLIVKYILTSKSLSSVPKDYFTNLNEFYLLIQLICVYLAIIFITSSGYHACRADLSINSSTDICEDDLNVKFPANLKCNTPSFFGISHHMLYETSKLLDHFMAWYAIFLTFCYIYFRLTHHSWIYAFIWLPVLLFLQVSTENNPTKYMSYAIMLLIIIPVFMALWSHRAEFDMWVWLFMGAGILFFLVALGFFMMPGSYYLYHSLWHIFGAISGACFLVMTLFFPSHTRDVVKFFSIENK